jgi:hypothetical protein
MSVEYGHETDHKCEHGKSVDDYCEICDEGAQCMNTLELQNFFERHAPVLWEDRWTCRCGRWALGRKHNSIEVADKYRALHLTQEFEKEFGERLLAELPKAPDERNLTDHQKAVEEAAGMGLDWSMANFATPVGAAQPVPTDVVRSSAPQAEGEAIDNRDTLAPPLATAPEQPTITFSKGAPAKASPASWSEPEITEQPTPEQTDLERFKALFMKHHKIVAGYLDAIAAELAAEFQRVREDALKSMPALTDDVEALSAELHAIYQAEAKRQGDVRHHDDYADLKENVKEFDRVLARFILQREARVREEMGSRNSCECRDTFRRLGCFQLSPCFSTRSILHELRRKGFRKV